MGSPTSGSVLTQHARRAWRELRELRAPFSAALQLDPTS